MLFLICLIFVQFEANLEQSYFECKFYNICHINFETLLAPLLMSLDCFSKDDTNGIFLKGNPEKTGTE